MSYLLNNLTNTTYTSYNANITSTGTSYTLAPNWNDTISIASNDNSLLVKGDAKFEGALTIQGKSIKDSLDKIEERLAILHPNEELEEKWDKLRGLRKMYMELEAEIIEKEKMWAILKK